MSSRAMSYSRVRCLNKGQLYTHHFKPIFKRVTDGCLTYIKRVTDGCLTYIID